MTRILFISQNYAVRGGAESYLLRIMNGLYELGHEVGCCYLQRSPDDHISGLWLERYIAPDQLRYLSTTISEFKPDVIHINDVIPTPFLDELLEKAPCVFFEHAFTPFACPGDGRFWTQSGTVCTRRVGSYCLIAPYLHHCGTRHFKRHWDQFRVTKNWQSRREKFSKFLVASRFMKATLVDEGIEESQISIVSLPAPHMKSLPAPQEKAGAPTFVFAGRFIEHKGGDFLLRALETINTPIQLFMVGDGREYENWKDLALSIVRKHPRHVIQWMKWQSSSEIQKLFAQSRAVVVPSLWPEPFGLVGLEAMAVGCPVIAHDRGGIEDWLTDLDNGLLIREPTLEKLGTAIERLATDVRFARNLGSRGLERVEKEFQLDEHLRRLLENYQNIS